MKCYPWVINNCCLIGDAAHTILPFLGEGCNSGFEDCYIFNDMLDKYNDDLSLASQEY